ncbi:hypothetical protein A2111_00175 [Candidatus Daviesbacteria bacterium GWA1_38_6]|nr:MAG: hypothetical protein A2111_00175 [Candidatus Daviesbacteria bacterium GWA1_38_6]
MCFRIYSMVVVLYNIRSVFNVGSIFRTTDGAGIEKIYLCGVTPTPLDKFGLVRSDFTKVSLGAEKSVEWEQKHSTVKLLDRLKKEGYLILAVEQDPKSVPYYEIRLPRPSISLRARNDGREADKICLVMGSEVNGLPKSILDKADKILEIPMKGKKESLNVAIAFGIVAYHLMYGYIKTN